MNVARVLYIEGRGFHIPVAHPFLACSNGCAELVTSDGKIRKHYPRTVW